MQRVTTGTILTSTKVRGRVKLHHLDQVRIRKVKPRAKPTSKYVSLAYDFSVEGKIRLY